MSFKCEEVQTPYSLSLMLAILDMKDICLFIFTKTLEQILNPSQQMYQDIHGPIASKIFMLIGVWLARRHKVHLLKGDTSVEFLLVKTWHNAHSNDPQKAARL